MPVAVIAEVVSYTILASSVGGSIGSYCADNPGVNGCVNKRDILNTESIPPIMASTRKRQDVGPCGVPKYVFDLCHDEGVSAGINSSIPSPGEARFDHVPPTCMTLSGALLGGCTNSGPRVEACGTDCLHYTGLTDEDFAHLSNALNGK
ncbi:uncharacterized protein F4807DRAFT_462537 [Annulohypoxylon truncatum]|uniref:uncharacterized protein n=1 Tax=Annulohypoxylon truncatum TaxID=327061 RepID=UPI0020083551|nr:uncharacterized protein F4807DRAFT_462537 [Annulohypoxylon truncatum]KAI1207737.1 hypothetical protein F4807DRAFT_462537 [Annulohypoxylon truncatum]